MFKTGSVVFLVLSALLFASCQKEISTEIGQGNTSEGVLKMKINGSPWTANKFANVNIIAGFIHIIGTSSDNRSLTITLTDTVLGIYTLDRMSFHAAAVSDSADMLGLSFTTNEGKDTADAGGTVIVTSIDKMNKTISGTFRFKAYRDFDNKLLQITEGVFEKLSYSPTLPPASGTDTFDVKIDNGFWAAKSITGHVAGTEIFITGSAADLSKLVGITVPLDVLPGTYPLGLLSGQYVGIYSPVTTSILTAVSGRIVILAHNKVKKRIRGYFDFKAFDPGAGISAQLTEGYFSIIYQ